MKAANKAPPKPIKVVMHSGNYCSLILLLWQNITTGVPSTQPPQQPWAMSPTSCTCAPTWYNSFLHYVLLRISWSTDDGGPFYDDFSRSRMGPLNSSKPTTLPFCRISMHPRFTKRFAASRVAHISGRQSCGLSLRGTSLGQHVAPCFRARRISKIVASSCWSCSMSCASSSAFSASASLLIAGADVFGFFLSFAAPASFVRLVPIKAVPSVKIQQQLQV